MGGNEFDVSASQKEIDTKHKERCERVIKCLNGSIEILGDFARS